MPVYPRVGGGNPAYRRPAACPAGLSPRGRGKHRFRVVHPFVGGSIPAWAGETVSGLAPPCPSSVYPRVGGGNIVGTPGWWGSYGLSPRGRGKQSKVSTGILLIRSIPAWAGETPVDSLSVRRWMVYPRVGGGNPPAALQRRPAGGLSPRGRGKRRRPALTALGRRSIPAWAGETGAPMTPRPNPAVYPRVGGGNAWPMAAAYISAGLSPRGRGKPIDGFYEPGRRGSIPAWAGETPLPGHAYYPWGVYPRVGGGNPGPG